MLNNVCDLSEPTDFFRYTNGLMNWVNEIFTRKFIFLGVQLNVCFLVKGIIHLL